MPKPATSQPSPQRPESDAGTTRVMRHQESEPRLPHEHDESSDSQAGPPDERVKQAARDLEAGLLDTGRAPVVEKLARDHFPPRDAGKQPKR